MRMKRNVLDRFVRVTGVGSVMEITDEVMGRWIVHETGRGVRTTSVNMYNAVVAGLVRYCREAGMEVSVNLALIVKMKGERTERKFYTAAEVARVTALAREVGDDVTALQIEVMFETGMRIAELTRLRVGDFGGVDGRRVRFVGKGRRLREVYVTGAIAVVLREYVERYDIARDGYLWCVNDGTVSLNGEPPTVNTVRARLRRAFARAGFAGFYPHALRHSFATDLQLRGASVAEIKEMIGHANIATTERYLHGLEGKMRELFEKYR